METQHVEVHMYLMVGFQLIFLAISGSCVHSSSFSSEVGKCDSNFDPSDSNISTKPCFEKYLMKSYVGKHDKLLDLDFQNFIANNLPPGSCEASPDNLNVVIRLSVQQRYLIGEGSHRRLFSSIRLKIQPESLSELPRHFSEVIIIERLPSGVFADPFELQHLVQRGVFTDAAVFGDTNLELPSFLSNQSVVEVHMDIGLNVLSRHENGLKFNVELPLHARYPPLEESGYSRVEFGAPDLFIRYSIEGKSRNRSCLLKLIDDSAESKTDAVLWRIPSGTKAHAGAVSVVTFISALLSTLLIVLTSIYYSDIKLCKNLKKS